MIMKTIILFWLLFNMTVNYSNGQKPEMYANNKESPFLSEKKTYNNTAHLSLFNGRPNIIPFVVRGHISADDKRLQFFPDTVFSSGIQKNIYQYNYLLKDVEIEYNEILKVRRNWFFLVPYRLIITTVDQQVYRFSLKKRKELINRIKLHVVKKPGSAPGSSNF